MKQRVLCLILICSLVLTLFSCANNLPADGKTETQNKTESDTTGEVEKEETEEPEEEKQLSVNTDIIDDLGKTYGELTEKYGKLVDAFTFSGAIAYSFDGGYGRYVWGLNELDRNDPDGPYIPKKVVDGVEVVDIDSVPKPFEDKVTTTFIMIEAEDFFLNADMPISTDDISALEGMECIGTGRTGPESIVDTHYYSIFYFNDQVTFEVYHNDMGGTVDVDSLVNIRTGEPTELDRMIGKYSDDCRHSLIYDFADDMTVKGVYKGNRVEDLIRDVWDCGDEVVVLYNGEEVTEGEILVGMVVEIYHGETFVGSYVVEALLDPVE